jgi:excisionase family DNA binding protein
MGIGNVLSQSLSGMTGQQGAGAAPQRTDGPESGAVPSIMTPAEAANVMRVSEEDVVAAIQAGDLKARKIGNAYRISKEALDDFLKG